eukprot:5016716-Pleurochrysis_carterae.AAC.1
MNRTQGRGIKGVGTGEAGGQACGRRSLLDWINEASYRRWWMQRRYSWWRRCKCVSVSARARACV